MCNDGLREITVDLHVHTCLSPCATLDMTPRKIVARAVEMKLDMIAVTDHNSAENAGAVMRAAAGVPLTVLPGFEVTSAEEAHVVCLFDRLANAHVFQELVYERLQAGENDENLFGLQVVANEDDEVEGMNPRLLIGATSLRIEELVAAVHSHHGLAIASHIDREMFSLVGVLGFIPPGLALDGVEISRRMSLLKARQRFPEYAHYPFVAASDAHDLNELGVNPMTLRAAAPDFAELRRALRGEEGRGLLTPGAMN